MEKYARNFGEQLFYPPVLFQGPTLLHYVLMLTQPSVWTLFVYIAQTEQQFEFGQTQYFDNL